MNEYSPDLLLVGCADDRRVPAPVPRARVARSSRTARPTRPTTTSSSTARPTAASPAGEVHPVRAYKGAEATLTLARKLAGGNPTTFISSDHGFGPQFLAIDASQPLVELGLLSKPQTSNCRPAAGETIGKAKACWAGGALQIYLNLAGRDPAGTAFQQVGGQPCGDRRRDPAAYLGLDRPQRLDARRPARGLEDDRPGLHQGRGPVHPERRRQHADMAHPTRTGDLVVFAYPPYQFDAATPGDTDRAVAVLRPARLRAGRPGPRRATSTCGRRSSPAATGIAKGTVTARTIDLAPTLAYMLGIPEPQQSQGRVLLDVVKGGNGVQADLDRRAQRLPRPARADRPSTVRQRRSTCPSAARAPSRRCSTRSSRPCRARG